MRDRKRSALGVVTGGLFHRPEHLEGLLGDGGLKLVDAEPGDGAKGEAEHATGQDRS